MAEGKMRNSLPIRLILYALMVVVIGYLGFGFARQAIASQQRREALRQIEQEVAVAHKEAGWLEERLQYMQSPEAAEEWARDNGWVKDGEVSVVIVAPASAEAPVPGAETQNAAQAGSNREAWWDLFFGEP
jgi:cell division protein FtsB